MLNGMESVPACRGSCGTRSHLRSTSNECSWGKRGARGAGCISVSNAPHSFAAPARQQRGVRASTGGVSALSNAVSKAASSLQCVGAPMPGSTGTYLQSGAKRRARAPRERSVPQRHRGTTDERACVEDGTRGARGWQRGEKRREMQRLNVRLCSVRRMSAGALALCRAGALSTLLIASGMRHPPDAHLHRSLSIAPRPPESARTQVGTTRRLAEGQLMKASRACVAREFRTLRLTWRLWRARCIALRSARRALALVARLRARCTMARAMAAWRGERCAKAARVCRLMSEEVRGLQAALAAAQRDHAGLVDTKEALVRQARAMLGALNSLSLFPKWAHVVTTSVDCSESVVCACSLSGGSIAGVRAAEILPRFMAF